MISVAGIRLSRCAAFGATLSAVLLAITGCGGGDSSAQHPSTATPAKTAAETRLPTLESLKFPAVSGTLLTEHSGRGARRLEVPLAKAGTQVTVRLICLGPGDAKVTDGSGGSVLEVAGCNATAAYTTQFTGVKSDRVMRLAVAPTVQWRLLVWG
ncbi:hypothetical protein AB0D86_16690 [Streptomyces sp. NPDC048324]|uniref:hypothetical protein n=1 Tax=Streptomyces sp. NPDC048324 TaxID=3157205 RepID=UPI00342C82F7